MKVCVDPGHGMSNRQIGIFDPGAVHVENGFQFQEAAIALRYGLSLKDVLREHQISVFMTRDDDTDHAPVIKRARMAKDAGCDLLVSLHLNDFESDEANGLEVLYNSEQNKELAARMQQALLSVTGMRDRQIKSRPDLAVSKFEGPSVLIELGFIANDSDRGKLLNSQIRDDIVRTIAKVALTGVLAV